jgi:glycosyltransferase involved in cell wall biosynthesis
MNREEQRTLWHLLETRDHTAQRMGRQLREKENAIHKMENILQQKEALLLQKENLLNKQARAIQAYRLAYWPLRPFVHFARIVLTPIRRLLAMSRPRLGNLNQHPARPLDRTALITQTKRLSEMPTLSIITPSYQQGDYIARTIQSVLDQGYPNLQYFVQDGGSKDSTVGVLKQYEDKLSGWTSEKDSGQSQAINLGFAHTDGEIMAWLNSDDLLLPGALATVADYFNRHPEVDVVYGNRLLIDEHDMQIGRWILPGHNSKVLSWVDYVPQETLFWRRRIWDKAGGQIDESFRFAMDWDLLVRFRDAGAKFAHIPRFLGAFRIHEHQKTSAVINEIGHQEMDRIRERLLGRVPDRKEVRKAVIPFLLKHVIIDKIYGIKTRLGGKS